jgi:class 3 adenylate cyclase
MEQKDYRLAAIMYTDIAGFSRMMEVDETGTLELLAYHNELIKGIVESHHGTVIKTIGDALLVDFKNTVEALRSAMAIQDALYAHNKENPGLPLLVRIGLHLGDIYFFENDALGEGINIAARLQSLARPGCICFSQDIYNIVLNKIEFRAEKLGKVSLKNITKEIHAYEITTPNVEFDPNRDKPRPGYEPGSYLDEGGADATPVGGTAASYAPRSSLAAQKKGTPGAEAASPEATGSAHVEAASPEAMPERSYSEEGSRDLLAELRRVILEDTKAMGRRMTVDEARSRYGSYGVEADEVIAAMAEQGLIARRRQQPEPSMGSGLPDFIAGFGRNDRGEFDANALKSNIEAAVHGIVGEIERSALRNASEGEKARYAEKFDHYEEKYRRHAESAREHAERHAERHRDRAELRAEFHGHSGALEGNPEGGGGDFEVYKRRLEARGRGSRGGFIGNLTSFIAVNAGLWFMNLTFAAPAFHWAAFVSAAWGIGLVSTAVAASRAGAKLREIDAMPEIEGERLADYKKLNRMKDSIAQHAATTVMVPLLLAVINFMTGPGFLWFLIPSAAMLVGFLSHAASYAASKPRLERKILDALGIKGGWREIFRLKARRASVSGLGPYADLYREAEAAKEAIAALLASGQAGTVDADLAPSLDQYLSQVKLLAQSANEIDRLVEGIPMIDLAKDREALVAKESAASAGLKAEYRKSIEEIDKQEKSYQDLKEQSEVVRLRLGSSVNQLKQMRIDITRLQASPSSEGASGIGELKRRTDELSRYLEDLRSGYAESSAARGEDPFVELEREEKRRLAENAESKKGIEGPKA